MACACTPPVLVPKDGPVLLWGPLLAGRGPAAGSAYGDAVICVDGESYAGSAEVRWDSGGGFRAHFYAPLGALIASAEGDGGSGRVQFDGGDYSFGSGQTMDTLPFSWGSDLSFGDLALMLRGRVPPALGAVFDRPPDTVVEGRTAINAVWKTDTCLARAKIRRKGPGMEEARFERGSPGARWVFSLRKFKRGIAHKIELRENDRNYFLIKYTNVNVL
jgi:hypothetical protein